MLHLITTKNEEVIINTSKIISATLNENEICLTVDALTFTQTFCIKNEFWDAITIALNSSKINNLNNI